MTNKNIPANHMKRRGTLIIIEGQDGSGKATQVELLAKRLRKEGHPVHIIDFPRYGEKSASLVEEYLKGVFGGVEDVSPKAASIFYAADRFAASKTFVKRLERGEIVIANRYVTSNEAHQGAKIASSGARERFWKWNDDLEYNVFGIPKPDRVYFLHMPTAMAVTLIEKRNAERQAIRKDIHEENLRYLERTERVYRTLAKRSKKWKTIECAHDDTMRTREDIHEELWGDVQQLLKKRR